MQRSRTYNHHHHHNHFMALFLGPPGWAGARTELLDIMVQGKINRGRHTDHPDGRHSILTKQCLPPPSPIFYRPDALPAAQPTVSKHWRQTNIHVTKYSRAIYNAYNIQNEGRLKFIKKALKTKLQNCKEVTKRTMQHPQLTAKLQIQSQDFPT